MFSRRSRAQSTLCTAAVLAFTAAGGCSFVLGGLQRPSVLVDKTQGLHRVDTAKKRSPSFDQPREDMQDFTEVCSSSMKVIVSMVAMCGLVLGMTSSPATAAIEDKAALEKQTKDAVTAANDAKATAEREAVQKEKAAIMATVELKKKAEKEIEERVNLERTKQIAARDEAMAAAHESEKAAVVVERAALKETVDLKKKAEKEIELKVQAEVQKIYAAKKLAFLAAEEQQTATLRKNAEDKAAAIAQFVAAEEGA